MISELRKFGDADVHVAPLPFAYATAGLLACLACLGCIRPFAWRCLTPLGYMLTLG